VFSVDNVVRNTEQACPFGLIDDPSLFDTKSLSNGAHTIKAVGASTVTATFTVDNAAPPPPTATATINWTAPTQNVDSSALTDLAGFRILYGTSATTLTQTIQVANPGTTSFVVPSLAAGTWHFAVRAYNSVGVESVNSTVASKVVP